MEAQEQDAELDAAPEDQAITPDGAPAALVDTTETPPPATGMDDFKWDDLEFDGPLVNLPNGLELTLRGIARAAATRMGKDAEAWNALGMDVRQDAVAEEFVALCDLLQRGADPMSVEIVPPVAPDPRVVELAQARALPLQPECTVAQRVPHEPGTVVRFKEEDGTTMVVVSLNGMLFKAPADDQPKED